MNEGNLGTALVIGITAALGFAALGLGVFVLGTASNHQPY